AVAVVRGLAWRRRHADAGAWHVDRLRLPRGRGAGQVAKPAHQSLAKQLELLRARPIIHGGEVELTELLLQCHAGEEGVDVASWGGGLGREDRRDAAP